MTMEMCRVCLATEKGMQPLEETFIIQYNLLTNLNITLCDGMPQFSCKTCVNTVKYYIEFREKSIASEATLREIICSAVKSESEKLEIQYEKPIGDNEDNIKTAIKCEIKEEDNDSALDNYDVSFEEYDGDLKNIIVKQDKEDVKLKEIKKKNNKNSVSSKKRSKFIQNLPDDGSWFCGICPKSFEDKGELKEHLEVHKNHRQCELCKEKVNSLSQLLAHRLVHVPTNQLRCHICAKRYKSCIYLEHHYRVVHIDSEDSKLSCKFCQSTYSTPKKLNNHIIHVHSSIKFFCDVCSKGFANKTNLKSHIKQHSKIKAYVCDLCGFSCKYSSGLKDHKIRRHAEEKIYCKNCTRAFPSQEDYDRHKCKDKLKVCTVCGVQLTGSSRLSRHMARHSDIHRYECKRCPAKYKTKAALVTHNNRHDGNRTQQCEYCPAKFYSATVLIKHRRIHTGEKPYVCKVCNKGFTGRHNLKVHMKVHGEYLIVKKNSEADLNNLNNVTK